MSPLLDGAGVELSYSMDGTGPAVLLVHGIGRTRETLDVDARVVSYDRRGYGASGAPEPYERTAVEEQAEDAAALAQALGLSDVVAAGWDFGGLVCLDLLRRHGTLARAAVVVDPWLFALVPDVNQMLAFERNALEEDLREQGPAVAVQRFAERSGLGPEAPAMGLQHRGFFADYGGAASWTATRRELRAITAPVTVVATPGALEHVRRASEATAGLLPRASIVEGDDVGGAVERLLRA